MSEREHEGIAESLFFMSWLIYPLKRDKFQTLESKGGSGESLVLSLSWCVDCYIIYNHSFYILGEVYQRVGEEIHSMKMVN
jgi:hypothetical protein